MRWASTVLGHSLLSNCMPMSPAHSATILCESASICTSMRVSNLSSTESQTKIFPLQALHNLYITLPRAEAKLSLALCSACWHQCDVSISARSLAGLFPNTPAHCNNHNRRRLQLLALLETSLIGCIAAMRHKTIHSSCMFDSETSKLEVKDTELCLESVLVETLLVEGRTLIRVPKLQTSLPNP